MVALRWLFWCILAINVLWLFLKVPWVDLQCVLVVFPGHTHLFLCLILVLWHGSL